MTINGNGTSAGDHSDGQGQDSQDNDRWRQLCRMVADEKNPTRMSALLDELITILDQRRRRYRHDGPSNDAARQY
jgi:hypothetical protein